ncbi:MAG: bifunctional oligoribonuclease/PAP phosphatase NrnA [Salinivirgaceae bacterium]|nr:bifunctional oligoribonuclease/PAP phosphatase NrnA [Salinivirgaceae bacterium]
MEKITDEFISGARQAIHEAHKVVILTHKNPDGDALGSGLAFFHFFKNLGKEVTFIAPNQLPVYLLWMPGISDVLVYETRKDQGKEIIRAAELLVMVDFNHRSRLSEVGDVVIPHKVPKILIDHHPYPEDIATFIYSRVSSSSTAEMVFEFIEKLFGEDAVTKSVAECLYVGIMTDTGSFSYNSSEPLTFAIVGKLLKKGVDKDSITDKVYNNFSEHRLRLLGHSMNGRMRVVPEYQTAYIFLTKKDLDDYHHEPGDTEGFVNFPLSIRGVVFSAIFIEKEGYTKCSFRSKGSFPANLVAKEHFGGGGHINAAGGECKMPLEESLKKFESILPQYKTYLNPPDHE